MQSAAGDGRELSPQQGWEDIHATMEQLRSSMYVAGTATILLVWGAIISLGYFAEYSFTTFLEDFATDRPWIRAPLWFGLVGAGMVASALIGSRASQKDRRGRRGAVRRHPHVPLLAHHRRRRLRDARGARPLGRG